MAELHLLRPLWLWALLPAALIWWALWRQQDRVSTWKQVIDPHLLDHLLVGDAEKRRLAPIHLLLLLPLLGNRESGRREVGLAPAHSL